MPIDLTDALKEISEEERKKFLEHIVKGVSIASKPISNFAMRQASAEASILTDGAEFLSETITSFIEVSKLYRYGLNSDRMLSIYLYCIVNLTLVSMIEKGLLGHDDISLVGSIFAAVDLEVVDRLLGTWEKENGHQMDESALKSQIEIMNSLLSEIQRKSGKKSK
jgi:hypothetical protein